ncbi:MAG TPA: DUF1949 domain-containing protein, partial [Thiotrichales bacterium]|nr:DUF1949 domain-containing protein [Thiotrichales bacterium]
VMSVLPIQTFIPMQYASTPCDYGHEQHIRHWVDKLQGSVFRVEYLDPLTMEVNIPEAEINSFIQHLKTLHHITFQIGELCPH